MTDADTSMDSVNSPEQPEPADLSMCSSKRAREMDLNANGFQPHEAETEDAVQTCSQGSGDDTVKIKDEFCGNSKESMEPDASEDNEVTDLSCGYGSEYPSYNNIQLERHQVPYDINRPGMGKLYCDICGLACNSLNVLLVHKRSHTGERPFQCNQCGASFTQKGNLLRHGKLHTGEKPFKCHLCSYACQRRDALSGHLRTHSVEKPYKCEFCGRSYKQRSSLEEHKERCRIYLQNVNESASDDSQQPKSEMGSERAMVLDRIASNVAKRKSSMPQKFIGEKRPCYEVSYNNFLYDKDSDLMPPRIVEQNLGNALPYLNNDVLRPLVHTPPTSTAEMVSVISGLYPIPLTRVEMANGHLPAQSVKEKRSVPERDHSPVSNSLYSVEAERGHEDRVSYPPSASYAPRSSNVQQIHKEPARAFDVIKHSGLSHREILQVLSKEGCPIGVYRCDHCCVLFLDYVMFTIHMGCHGFRDPFECNMCGHRSQDRYEFSSHIARGEHHAK